MEQGTNVYPWDIEDDPGAAARIAQLGVDVASVASSYHTIRAVMPRNPRRTVLDARHAATYFTPDPDRYAGLRLQPSVPDWVGPDAYATAQQRLREHGLAVHAWTVVLHSTRHGHEHPDLTIENAFGDRYPYALCPAHPDVRAYATALIGDLTHRLRPDAIELESWGYLGITHGSHHDKVGVDLDPFHQHLLSLCFNAASVRAVGEAGGDPERIRQRVVEQLRRCFAGEVHADPDARSVGDRLDELLGPRDASALTWSRHEVTASLLRELRQAMPSDTSPTVHIHATPSPHDTGSAVGIDPSAFADAADAAIVPLFGRTPDEARSLMTRMAAAGRGLPPVATLPLFGPGARTHDEIIELARAVASVPIAGVRYYHWGLVTAERAGWIAELAEVVAGEQGR